MKAKTILVIVFLHRDSMFGAAQNTIKKNMGLAD